MENCAKCCGEFGKFCSLRRENHQNSTAYLSLPFMSKLSCWAVKGSLLLAVRACYDLTNMGGRYQEKKTSLEGWRLELLNSRVH